MNVVDSSAWLEYIANGPNADIFAVPIEATRDLVVPAITLFEVFKRVLQQSSRTNAEEAVAQMARGTVVPLDADLAVNAAEVSHQLKLPLADAIILTTARRHGAVLWTMDDHFAGMPDVRYVPKASTAAGP